MPELEYAEMTCASRWTEEWADSTGARWRRNVPGDQAMSPLEVLALVTGEGWELFAVTAMNHATRVYTLTRPAGSPPTIPPGMRREDG
jgi:hypothetical protein